MPLTSPVQEPQGHVPGLPHGEAGVPRRQWPPDICLLHLPMDPPPSPEWEGGTPSWGT